MTDPIKLGLILPRLGLPTAAGRTDETQLVANAGVHRPIPAVQRKPGYRIEKRWIPVLAALFQSERMARLGPYGIAAYIFLKTQADLHNGQTDAVSAVELGRLTGMSERAARKAAKDLETEGMVRVTRQSGKKKIYQLVERIPIVDTHGKPAGEAAWDYNALNWGRQLSEVAAALEALDARHRALPHPTTINIGSININVLVTDENAAKIGR